MVSVGFLYNMADTLAFGDSVICQLDQSWVNKWPSKVLRLAWNSLAYSSDTSTLLVCGGNYVSDSIMLPHLALFMILRYKKSFCVLSFLGYFKR